MSTKTDYTQDEWDLLQGAILEAGGAVMALEPGGMVRESLAVFRALDEAAEEYADNPLIVALTDFGGESAESEEDTESAAADTTSDVPEASSDPQAAKESMLQQLRQAVSILQAKGSPREVEAYREVVVAVAVKTAAATKTGGFLGIGGKRIDSEELQLIGEIKDAVGYVD